MEKHFCQILTRDDKTVLAEYVVEAVDWYYARHKAADLFRQQYRKLPIRLLSDSSDPMTMYQNWYVDSCIMD